MSYTIIKSKENGKYDVVNIDNFEKVSAGLTWDEAAKVLDKLYAAERPNFETFEIYLGDPNEF